MSKTGEFIETRSVATLLGDDATVGLPCGGGGLAEASVLREEVEKGFLEADHPRGDERDDVKGI